MWLSYRQGPGSFKKTISGSLLRTERGHGRKNRGVGNNSTTLVSLQSDAVNIMLCSRLHCTLYAPYGPCALVQHSHSVVTPARLACFHLRYASKKGVPYLTQNRPLLTMCNILTFSFLTHCCPE